MMPQPKILFAYEPSSLLLSDALLVQVAEGGLTHDPRLNAKIDSDGGLSIAITETLSLPVVVHFSGAIVPLRINVGKQACLHLIEHFSAQTSTTSATTVALEENARGYFYQISEIPEASAVHHRRQVHIAKDSYFSNHCINLSLGTFTHDIAIELLGPQASLDFFLLDQLYQSADTTTNLTIFHRSPTTESRQKVRAIYADKARGTFLGKVIVDEAAAKSSAQQHYKTLLLSAGAKASVMPQLEINNFDISASHGATIGELDVNALFYLQSRGLSLLEAKTLLVAALSSEIIESISLPELQRIIEQKVSRALLSSLEDRHA
jgi:Fe-S cluster assembly protein SufD